MDDDRGSVQQARCRVHVYVFSERSFIAPIAPIASISFTAFTASTAFTAFTAFTAPTALTASTAPTTPAIITSVDKYRESICFS